MEAIAQTAAPPAEEVPVPVASSEAARSSWVNSAAEAIELWQRAMEQEADAKRDAELLEAHALIAAYANADLKNDAARKAHATIASADAYRNAEVKQAWAKAAGAMVDLLLGGRAR